MSGTQGRVFVSHTITTKALIRIILSLIVVGSICTLLTRTLASPIVSDDFNDNSLDTAKWDANNLFSGFTNTNVAIAETSQRLEIGPLLQNVSGSSYRGICTVNSYNFSNAYSFVELVQAPASNTAGDAMFTIGNDVNNYYRLYVSAGNLIGQKKIGGTKTTLFTTTYDTTNHRFLRIRHTDTGAVTLDTAPGSSGVPGTWTQRYTETWNSSISTSAIVFEVKGGTWQVEANAPGKVIFDNFEVAGNTPAPTVTAISPTSGTTSGGTSVTITGTGFLSGATVSLGGSSATNITVVSSTSITATTPAHTAGTVDVVVTNTDSQSGTLSNGYTYSPPETVVVFDNFNDNSLDTAKWDSSNLFSGFTNTNVPIAETSQRLEIGPLLQNVSGSSYRGIRTVSSYNFTDGYTYVELVQAPASNTGADAMFTIGNSVTAYYRMYVSAGNLIGLRNIGGTKTTLFTTTYDTTNHRFLRIRHDSGNLTMDTAPGSSGVPGTWTQRYTETWNSSISTSSIIFELKGGTSQVEANAPGKVIFDNFHVAIPGAPTSSLPAPTKAPVAHPLAPNPHTSVGLFWTYTDPNTGRQWALSGGTYKIKRCTGASCTPTTVIASGLANKVGDAPRADYQDTGLTANTTYGYRYVANDGGDSADSPTVYVTTLSADSTSVQFPNATYEELLGPLPEMGQVPFAYYNSTATTRAQTMIPLFPYVVPFLLQGTGSITNNTTTITGTNSFYLEQVAANNPNCTNHIMINGVDAGTIASVNSNTSITLSTTWTGGTQTNVAISTNVAQCGYGDPFSDYLTANELYYYDSPQSLWSIYFMTGDPQYLRGAVKGSESVFAGHLRLGRNRDWVNAANQTDQAPSPRNFQFGGLVLLGLAGRTDVWDMLDKYLTDRYMIWIGNYRPSNGNQLWNREQSYMLQFTSWFVTAAPDSFTRSDGTTTSANGTITVDGDLTDGRKKHWKDQLDTDIPGLIAAAQSPEGNYRTQSVGASNAESDFPYPTGIAQPFMSGLTYDALGYAWRNTRLATATRDSARKQVLKAVAYLYHEAYNTNVMADDTSKRWRTGWYAADGGTRLNPFAFRYGSDSSILNNTPDNNMPAQYRQVLPMVLAPVGWAYEMSGLQMYKDFGDDMANAAFAAVGENTGATGDGIKAICDTGHYKNYGQCFRSTPKYFAQRLLSPSVLGTPPSVTMPSNQTLTNGVNQASLTASVSCSNTPCTYRWSLSEYHQALGRYSAQPMFSDETALSTKLSGLRPGTYKVVFYALDNLGLQGHGYVTVTVGDGVFPPVVVLQKEGGATWCTTGTSVTGINVRAYSAAGRSLTHSFSGTGPKDVGAPTITPSGTTGNILTVNVTGLSAGWWTLKDVVTDSAGASWEAFFMIAVVGTSCSGMTPPSTAHNTIPLTTAHPNHVIQTDSTTLFVAPIDPEGWSGFTTSLSGYTFGPNGDYKMPTALTHSWSQTAGPVTASIANGATLRPTVSGMTQSGTYTFRYTGTDQQGDSVQVSINVTRQ
jgi:IPT/TIG domain